MEVILRKKLPEKIQREKQIAEIGRQPGTSISWDMLVKSLTSVISCTRQPFQISDEYQSSKLFTLTFLMFISEGRKNAEAAAKMR